MRTVRAVVEYDGTDFCGMQFQPNLRSVAGIIEEGLGELLDESVKTTVAGRTDAGVHASGQVISFKTDSAFPIERLPIALNNILPHDVSMRAAEVVEDDFSARHSALERSYIYAIFNRPTPSAIARRYTHHVFSELSLEAMDEGARAFIGEHDFVSCCGVLPQHGPTIRIIREIGIDRSGDLVFIRISADGFLHRMVRIIAGTLIEMGSGRRDPRSASTIVAARDRRAAGYTAPPEGLFFVGVRYPDFDSFQPPLQMLR